MKPPIQYFGAKVTLAEQIVSFLPAHEGYVEPFAGSLAVLLAKPPVKVEVANDLDSRLVTFWRVLRERPEELARMADLTPHSRAELSAAQELDAEDDLLLAWQVWVTLTQGRARTLQRGGWRFYADTRGTSASFASYMDAYRARLLPAAERLRNVTLECRPALDIIAQYGAFETNLLYVDPPYAHSTRRGARYTHEMTDTDHRDLASALAKCNASVVVSGYASELYQEIYEGWHTISVRAHTGNSSNPERTEVLWSNRAIDDGFDFDTL